MNEWERASLEELLIENGEMLRMFYRMLNSSNDITSVISPIIVPYLALITEGNSSLIGGAENYPEINGKNYKKIIEKTRVRTKIYSSDRLAKSIKHIETNLEMITHDLTHDYNCFQRLYMNFFGQEILGLNLYKETPIFSNFLGYSYLSEFFEIDDLEQAKQALIQNSNIGLFAQYSSNYIFQVVSNANKYLIEPIIINDDSTLNINFDDLKDSDHLLVPVERQTFFKNQEIDLPVAIFLLDILCTINFVKILLPKMISDTSSLYLRLKLITYVSAVESIDKLSKGFNRKTDSGTHIIEITRIVEKKREIISQDIRNNLFHFSLSETNIPISKLRDGNIFFNYIEHLVNMPLSEYDLIVDFEIKKIQKLINKWIF